MTRWVAGAGCALAAVGFGNAKHVAVAVFFGVSAFALFLWAIEGEVE